MPELGNALLVVIYCVYLYLGMGVIFATMVYLGLLKFGNVKWEVFDHLDPDFRIKIYLYMVVCWVRFFI